MFNIKKQSRFTFRYCVLVLTLHDINAKGSLFFLSISPISEYQISNVQCFEYPISNQLYVLNVQCFECPIRNQLYGAKINILCISCKKPIQQTRHIDQMLGQCWSTLYDVGSKLVQRVCWVEFLQCIRLMESCTQL